MERVDAGCAIALWGAAFSSNRPQFGNLKSEMTDLRKSEYWRCGEHHVVAHPATMRNLSVSADVKLTHPPK